MATNIYVGNLPWSTTDAELIDMFSQYGTVTRAQVVMDRETG
ncbi:MAG: RNA-binding protein, partial [Gemmataceae bacterium]|nr:RNA-binding protein [Gemmataceae bacterium]